MSAERAEAERRVRVQTQPVEGAPTDASRHEPLTWVPLVCSVLNNPKVKCSYEKTEAGRGQFVSMLTVKKGQKDQRPCPNQ